MERFVLGFIRASLVWLGVGVVLGLAMAFFPGQALAYRAAHMHANLLGFVSMMIFGVAYHVIPRFSGNPLHSRPLAVVHLWVANVGLALMVGGWVARVHAGPAGELALRAGAAAAAVGAFLFIHNLWRTLGSGRPFASLPGAGAPPRAGAGAPRPVGHTPR